MARTKRKINPLLPETAPAAPDIRIYQTAGYVRLSVEDSGKPGADTIEGQTALIESYIAERNDLNLVSLFCDNGRTGTDFDRPQFEQMMDMVRKGKIDCIVVKDLSRFGRNYKETGNYLERIFPFLGVRFIAINDSFDTLTAERTQDGYIVPLKNLINEVYSKDISNKVSAALATKQSRGEFIGAWAPYGYNKDPNDKHHLVVNPETAPVVQQIFAWRKEDISVVQISRRLNDAGVLSPSAYLYESGAVKTEKYHGTLWQVQNVKNILEHPVYLGHMVQGRKKQSFYAGTPQVFTPQSEWKIVENTHEAIIDQETFDAVQALAKARNDAYQARLGRFDDMGGSPNILRGLVYCKHCGRPLVRYKNVSHSKKLWYTFICPTHVQDPARCPFVSAVESEVQQVLFTSIRSQMALAADQKALAVRKSTEPAALQRRSQEQETLENARRILKRSQALYDSLYQNYVEKLMTEDEYIRLKAKYKAEAEQAQQAIDRLTEAMREKSRTTTENPYFTAFPGFEDQQELTEGMAHTLIERVEIDFERNIDIRFKFRDEYEALTAYLEEDEP